MAEGNVMFPLDDETSTTQDSDEESTAAQSFGADGDNHQVIGDQQLIGVLVQTIHHQHQQNQHLQEDLDELLVMPVMTMSSVALGTVIALPVCLFVVLRLLYFYIPVYWQVDATAESWRNLLAQFVVLHLTPMATLGAVVCCPTLNDGVHYYINWAHIISVLFVYIVVTLSVVDLFIGASLIVRWW